MERITDERLAEIRNLIVRGEANTAIGDLIAEVERLRAAEDAARPLIATACHIIDGRWGVSNLRDAVRAFREAQGD